jgi:hypothetical protein
MPKYTVIVGNGWSTRVTVDDIQANNADQAGVEAIAKIKESIENGAVGYTRMTMGTGMVVLKVTLEEIVQVEVKMGNKTVKMVPPPRFAKAHA